MDAVVADPLDPAKAGAYGAGLARSAPDTGDVAPS